MSPNGYYNYLEDRKKEYLERTCQIHNRIVTIYHREDGVPGYRQMQSVSGAGRLLDQSADPSSLYEWNGDEVPCALSETELRKRPCAQEIYQYLES